MSKVTITNNNFSGGRYKGMPPVGTVFQGTVNSNSNYTGTFISTYDGVVLLDKRQDTNFEHTWMKSNDPIFFVDNYVEVDLNITVTPK
jgi:hypothetical protein